MERDPFTGRAPDHPKLVLKHVTSHIIFTIIAILVMIRTQTKLVLEQVTRSSMAIIVTYPYVRSSCHELGSEY